MNALLYMLQVCIGSYLNLVLRYKFLIVCISHPDTPCLLQRGCKDSWLFFEAKNRLTSERILEKTILKEHNRRNYVPGTPLSVSNDVPRPWMGCPSDNGSRGFANSNMAPAMLELLRNERFHGTHETCRLLVVIFNCLVLWSTVTKPIRSSLNSRRPVIRCEPRTLNKSRQLYLH